MNIQKFSVAAEYSVFVVVGRLLAKVRIVNMFIYSMNMDKEIILSIIIVSIGFNKAK